MTRMSDPVRVDCRIDPAHGPLTPIGGEAQCKLACEACGTAQKPSPEQTQAAEEAYQRHKELIWISGASAIGTSVLGWHLHKEIGGAIGFIVGILLVYFAKRKKARASAPSS